MTISRIYTQSAQKFYYFYTSVQPHPTKKIKCSFILVGEKLTKMIDCSHFLQTLPTISYYLFLLVLSSPRTRSAHFVKLLAENFVCLWHCIRAKYQNPVRFPRMKLVKAPKVWNWCHQSFIVTVVGTNLTKNPRDWELKTNDISKKLCVIFKLKRFTLSIQEQFFTFLKLALSRLLW